ncbi:MAG: radical SAM protein [Candidatus Pacearchaeota archaeon]|nr:radical SAM protein [Candidatus Pacearchaeota archaeon]
MKILIIVPKYTLSTERDYLFPLGLAYISSTLKREKYSVDCLNLNQLKGTVEDIISSHLNNNIYEYVLTGGNSMMFSQFQKIIQITRKKSSSKIIIGGPIITSEPELMLNSFNPDFAVIGEGEETIVELINVIEKKKNLKQIKGIIYKDKEKVIITENREPIKDLEKIPYPDFDGFGFEEHLKNMHNLNFQSNDFPRNYPILMSRGCPNNCTFCWHGTRYRSRSIKDVMKEIEWAISKFKINHLQIYDDCLGADKEQLKEFCKEIKKLSKKTGIHLTWNCQFLTGSVETQILKMMKDAGCEAISYGFESFSPTVLKSMRKPITPEQIDFALKETLKAKIAVQANFIFGDPAETKETAKETLDYWKKNANTQINLFFVQPYPGSDLYKYCIEKGIIKDRLDYIQNRMSPDARINMTKEMSDKEIHDLGDEILILFSKYAKFVRPISMKKTNSNIYAFKVKCPYCHEEIVYKNYFIPNPFMYGFHLVCRNCHMQFVLVGAIQRIAYRFYSKTRSIRDKYVSIKLKLGRMFV